MATPKVPKPAKGQNPAQKKPHVSQRVIRTGGKTELTYSHGRGNKNAKKGK